MHTKKIIEKIEFIQNADKYIKQVQELDEILIITQQNKSELVLSKVKSKTLADLRGFANIQLVEDINKPVFSEYSEW